MVWILGVFIGLVGIHGLLQILLNALFVFEAISALGSLVRAMAV